MISNGHNRKTHFIGAHADYRREDYVFARTQSAKMRNRRWEPSVSLGRHPIANLIADMALNIFA